MVHPEGVPCRRAPGTRLPVMSVQGAAGNRAGDKAACNISPSSGQNSQQSQTARDRAGHSYTYSTAQAGMGCPDLSLTGQGVGGGPREAAQGGYSLPVPSGGWGAHGRASPLPTAQSSHGTEGVQRNSLVWVVPDL